MELVDIETLPKSRLAALLEHLSVIEDMRDPWQVAHPLSEVLLLVVCGRICDCDDYDGGEISQVAGLTEGRRGDCCRPMSISAGDRPRR